MDERGGSLGAGSDGRLAAARLGAALGPALQFDDGRLVDVVQPSTSVGRGPDVDVRLTDAGVSRLHAELIRRGPYLYVLDAGLSVNGTFVNGARVVQRLLGDGDVVAFGVVRARVRGVGATGEELSDVARHPLEAELTGRELEVLTLLCHPAMQEAPFVAPASAREISARMFVTEAAVKQHLLRLYEKFGIPEGSNRREQLANAAVRAGFLHRRLCLRHYGSAGPAS